MNIVGIMGLAGSGKSAAAQALRDRGYIEVALADPMKRSAADWFGWDAQRLWGPSDARNEVDPAFGCSARKVLQLMGTELGRECYRNVWVDYAMRIATRLLRSPFALGYSRSLGIYELGRGRMRALPGVVIPDVRFRNEFEAIKAARGRVFRIVRADAGLTGEAAAHASEAEQLGIGDEEVDGVIVNDGTIEDLHRKVLEMVDQARAA